MSAKKRTSQSSAKLEHKVGRNLNFDGSEPSKVNGESFPHCLATWNRPEGSSRMAHECTSPTAIGALPARRRGRPRKSDSKRATSSSCKSPCRPPISKTVSSTFAARFYCKPKARSLETSSSSSSTDVTAEDLNMDICSPEGAAQLLNTSKVDLRSLKKSVSSAALDGKKVKQIVGMVKDDDGQLFTVLRFTDKSVGLVANSVLNKAYPQLVIKFYEAHLKWL